MNCSKSNSKYVAEIMCTGNRDNKNKYLIEY